MSDSPSPVRASAPEQDEAVELARSVGALRSFQQESDTFARALYTFTCDQLVEIIARGRQQAEQPVLNVSELREGEENDGSLQSTDLHIEGRGISLLCNVTAGQRFTYSLIVDGNKIETGTVGVYAPDRVQQAEQARDDFAAAVNIAVEQNVAADERVASLTQALKDAQGEAFKAGYHCQWIKAEMRYIFDPAMSPGDPDGAFAAWLRAKEVGDVGAQAKV